MRRLFFAAIIALSLALSVLTVNAQTDPPILRGGNIAITAATNLATLNLTGQSYCSMTLSGSGSATLTPMISYDGGSTYNTFNAIGVQTTNGTYESVLKATATNFFVAVTSVSGTVGAYEVCAGTKAASVSQLTPITVIPTGVQHVNVDNAPTVVPSCPAASYPCGLPTPIPAGSYPTPIPFPTLGVNVQNVPTVVPSCPASSYPCGLPTPVPASAYPTPIPFPTLGVNVLNTPGVLVFGAPTPIPWSTGSPLPVSVISPAPGTTPIPNWISHTYTVTGTGAQTPALFVGGMNSCVSYDGTGVGTPTMTYGFQGSADGTNFSTLTSVLNGTTAALAWATGKSHAWPLPPPSLTVAGAVEVQGSQSFGYNLIEPNVTAFTGTSALLTLVCSVAQLYPLPIPVAQNTASPQPQQTTQPTNAYGYWLAGSGWIPISPSSPLPVATPFTSASPNGAATPLPLRPVANCTNGATVAICQGVGPTQAAYVADMCQSNPKSFQAGTPTINTNTLAVSLAAGQTIYVCDFSGFAVGTVLIGPSLLTSAANACTSPSDIEINGFSTVLGSTTVTYGAWNYVGNPLAQTLSGAALCYVLAGTTVTSAGITIRYVQVAP